MRRTGLDRAALADAWTRICWTTRALVLASAEHGVEAGKIQGGGVQPMPRGQMADEIPSDAELLLRRRRRMHPGGALDAIDEKRLPLRALTPQDLRDRNSRACQGAKTPPPPARSSETPRGRLPLRGRAAETAPGCLHPGPRRRNSRAARPRPPAGWRRPGRWRPSRSSAGYRRAAQPCLMRTTLARLLSPVQRLDFGELLEPQPAPFAPEATLLVAAEGARLPLCRPSSAPPQPGPCPDRAPGLAGAAAFTPTADIDPALIRRATLKARAVVAASTLSPKP